MIIRGLIYFVALLVVSSVLMNNFQVPFGTISFFENHGIFFLIFITLFPRLTLLFSSVASGGIIWWLSWLFVPRILVATLATFAYFQTNPILVVISWLVALGGEGFEKRSLRHTRIVRQKFTSPKKRDAIDVEFKKL